MLHSLCCVVILLGAVPAAGAQQPNASVKLALHLAATPTPALKYQLLPEVAELVPGNAAVLYYRSFSPEWLAHRRQPELTEKVLNSIQTPFANMPKADLDFLLRYN